eukprot:2123368-Pleurochrysis_carterae.AAC.2
MHEPKANYMRAHQGARSKSVCAHAKRLRRRVRKCDAGTQRRVRRLRPRMPVRAQMVREMVNVIVCERVACMYVAR